MSVRMSRRGLFGLAAVAAGAAIAGGARLSVAHEGEDHGTPGAGATAHAMAGSGTGAAYFTVSNHGGEDDRLVATASDVAIPFDQSGLCTTVMPSGRRSATGVAPVITIISSSAARTAASTDHQTMARPRSSARSL